MLAAGARRILAFISSMVILLPSLALGEEVTMDDLVEREGLYYKKFTDVPFNGEVTGLLSLHFMYHILIESWAPGVACSKPDAGGCD